MAKVIVLKFCATSELPHTLTSKAKPWPLQIHTPEMLFLLSSPKTQALPKPCFLMRSRRCIMPAKHNTHQPL